MSEHDFDRMISVRASVIDDGDKRIKELESACRAASEDDEKDHKRIAELEAEISSICKERHKAEVELNLRREQMSRFPFCPDHRDKVHGKPCRECEVEHLRECLKRLEWCQHQGWPGHLACPVCHTYEVHKPSCWLAAECKEGSDAATK
jgi:hypothetical protein